MKSFDKAWPSEGRRLETKLLLHLGAGFLFLFCVVAVTSFALIRSTYEAAERREMEKSWRRSAHHMHQQATRLFERSFDWGKWDDMRDFSLRPQPEFVQTNLLPSSVLGMDLDGIVVLRPDLSPIHASLPHRQDLPALRLSSILKTLVVQSKREGCGLALVDGKVASISMRSIQDSRQKLPPTGWVIFVQVVTPEALKEMRNYLGVEVDLHIAKEESGFIHGVLPQEILSLEAPLLDGGGRPLAQLTVRASRQLMGLGDSTLYWNMVMILGIGIVSAVGGYWLMRRMVTGRLLRLYGQIRALEPSHGRGQVDVDGDDEIAEVGKALNSLMGEVVRYQKQLTAQEEFLEEANSRLEDLVAERTVELKRANSLLQHALDGVFCLDPQGVIRDANTICRAIFDRSVLIGLPFRDLLEPESQDLLDAALKKLSLDSRVEADLTVFPRPEGASHVQAVFVAERDEEGALAAIHGFVKDVSEHRRLAEELAYQAFHDSLTGLPNRQGLQRHMAGLKKADCGTVAALFIDLDDFKLVNDSMGHDVGDQVLVAASRALASCIRPSDYLVRLGGDEFTVVLQSLKRPGEAEEVAKRILKAFESPLVVNDKRFTVTASVGVALCSASFGSFAELLQAADTAMYQAKNKGKGEYIVFSPSMSQDAQERQVLIQAMRQAIAQGGFTLAYQPILSFSSFKPIAAEALLRWNHPELGPISPARFIPLAEETGLVGPMGAWVLKQACLTAKKLQDEGIEAGITVNVSPKQVHYGDFVGLVAQTLEEVGVEPRRVTLEITESLALGDMQKATVVLESLKSLGVMLAIDDFGTGYSSLSQLQKLTVDKVKLDKSFMTNLSTSSERVTVVGAIISICRALNLEVIAEGVEMEEEAEVLRVIGCDAVQGFLYSRPLPLEDLVEKLRTLDVRQAA